VITIFWIEDGISDYAKEFDSPKDADQMLTAIAQTDYRKLREISFDGPKAMDEMGMLAMLQSQHQSGDAAR
jgi:hypothetical protein